MSLLSLVRDPLDYFRPSLLLDPHLGLGLDDDAFSDSCSPRRLRRLLMSSPYTRNWRPQAARRDQGSTLAIDKDKFQVSVDVQQFTPDEITVKVCKNTVTVEGKHEEKEDEHGLVSRHFVRKYRVPEGHDVDLVQSKLSTDGVLTITAPKIQKAKGEERQIPITWTGEPSKAAIKTADERMEVEDAKKN